MVALLMPVAAAAGDRGADGRFEKRVSSHFILYQDVDIDESGGLRGSRRFEQQVLRVLEAGFDQLGDALGLRPPRKIEVVVYDPRVFDQAFARYFRFAAAGFYQGVIRIRGDTVVHTGLVRVLNHELVHAALDTAAPSFVYPGWFNEGLAEWFEARTLGKRHLSGGEFGALTRQRQTGGLFAIQSLKTPGFGRFGQDAARIAYLQSYGMVEFLVRRYGERKLREFVQALVRSRNLDRALSRVYSTDLAGLEERFLAELS